MRITSALFCFFLLSLPAAAASDDDIAAYLAARDRYIGDFNSILPTDTPSDDRMENARNDLERHALADLESQLKKIIPPWQAAGLSSGAGINLRVLHQDLGFGALDGLYYTVNGAGVIVTTQALFRNWISDFNKEGGFGKTPQSVNAAIRTELFWGEGGVGVGVPDEGWIFFGEVPVKIPGGTGVALLAEDTDSGVPDTGPKYLLVAVLRGDLVFVARQDLATKVSRQPVCEPLLWSNPETDQDKNFQACFAPHLHEQPQYDAIQKQAQALADLLR